LNNNEYVVFKLITGEQVLATLLNETKDGIVVIDPIQVRMVPMVENNEYSEQALTNRLCQFTDETEYVFNHKDIVYLKGLHPKMHGHYERLVLAFGEESKVVEEYYVEEDKREDKLDPNQLYKTTFKLH
jgi:hypothetical protein